MARSGIVVLVAMVVLAGGCRSTAAPTVSAPSTSSTVLPVRADEYNVAVRGWVIAPAGEPVMVCGIFLSSLPPQCGLGFEVHGLDLTNLPMAETEQGVVWTEGLVELVGTLNTAEFILTVSETPTVPESKAGLSTEPPCDEPAGGWPSYAISNDDVDLIRGYGERHADTWSGAWTDPGRQVWTVAFTDELSAHEAALTDLYDGPFCVTAAEYTRAELDAIRQEVLALSVEPTEHGPAVREALVVEVANHVWVLLWLNDEVALAPFSAFPEDAVSVSGWVEVLDTG